MIRLPSDPSRPDGLWRPRAHQLPVWEYLENGGTRACEVWHRRAGKDEFCLAWAAVASQTRVGDYWHMLPSFTQARRAIWEATDPHRGRRRIDMAFPREMRESTRNNDMFISFKNGSTWRVVGSDNYDSLVGTTPVGLTFSEYALANPSAWAYLRPILRENGGWALFISTARGKNHFHKLWRHAQKDETWHETILPATDTDVFDEQALESERLEYLSQYGPVLGQAMFEQEYLCSWNAATPGAFYAAEMSLAEKEGRITSVPHDPSRPVITSWDLGVSDSTVIIFWQHIGMRINVIDCKAYQNTGLDQMARDLDRLPYKYQAHIAPHDIEVREIGAGAQSRRTTARQLGIRFKVAPKLSVQEGIDAFRRKLGRMWFDREKCDTLIEALGLYRAEFDELRNVMKKNPLHDWTSDYADAARYYALARVSDDSEPIDYTDLDRAAI